MVFTPVPPGKTPEGGLVAVMVIIVVPEPTAFTSPVAASTLAIALSRVSKLKATSFSTTGMPFSRIFG